jgi:hypothetical protein
VYSEVEYLDFVNDPFNWKNAMNSIETIIDEDLLTSMENQLAWRPENLDYVYEINSKGYRSDEFIETRDIVFAGCSETWGIGVLEEGIWGNILSDKMGMKSYNLGAPGTGVQFIVNNLLAFFKEYGNPKFLFCLFPEFTRFEMRSDLSFMTSARLGKNLKSRSYFQVIKPLDPTKKVQYSKIPHLAEELIPHEFIFSISISYIKMLEYYCELNNIFFRWGTWDKAQDNYLSNNMSSLDFQNYVCLNFNKWEQFTGKEGNWIRYFHKDGDMCDKNAGSCKIKEECHEDIKHLYGRNFYEPMDLDIKNKTVGHMPIHMHAHIAEDFGRSWNDNSN